MSDSPIDTLNTTPGDAGSGRVVVLAAYSTDGAREIIARVWLDADGQVRCSDPALLARWVNTGIVGRADRGELFPKDGARFLEELPFMYKNIYMHAGWEQG